MKETEKQYILRKAKESLAYCQNAENEARKALASAIESTKRAREKCDSAFMAEEMAEVARLKKEYRHATS